MVSPKRESYRSRIDPQQRSFSVARATKTVNEISYRKQRFWLDSVRVMSQIRVVPSYRHAAGARNLHVQETQAAALRFFLRTRLPPAGAKKPARAFRDDL